LAVVIRIALEATTMIKRRQRRGQQEISEVQDRDYGWQTSVSDIVRVFSEHMRSKYRPIQVNEDSVRTMLETECGRVPDAWREILEMPMTAEELKTAVFKGDSKKSPGRDGIGLEFFKVLWEDEQVILEHCLLRFFGTGNYQSVRNKEP